MRPSPLARVLIGNGLSAIGSGLTMPLLIIYLSQVRGISETAAGFLLAYMAVLSLGLAPMIGTLIDRIGPRVVLVGGLVIQGAGVMALGLVTTTWQAFALGTVLAIGQAASWSPQAALLARLCPPERRQRIFGLQFMMLNLGLGIGGLVTGFAVNVTEPRTFQIVYLLDGVTYLAYALIACTIVAPPVVPADTDDQGRGGYRQVLADRRLLRLIISSVVLLTCGYGSLEVALPLLATRYGGLDLTWVGLAYACNTFTIVLAQLFALRLLAGRSRVRALSLVGVLWGLSWLVAGLCGLVPAAAGIMLCASTIVFAFGETLLSPVVPSLVNDLAPEHLRGRYNAAQSMSWGVAGTAGPAMAGLLLGAGLLGPWVILVVGGCFASSLMILGLRRHLTPAQDGRATEDDPVRTPTPALDLTATATSERSDGVPDDRMAP